MRNQPVILVVDDEPIARKSIQALLQADEYVIEGAVDGAEALAKIAEIQPDTIVMDVMMPGMDGYEVCSKIKANPQSQHIPVIMLTTLNDKQNLVRGLDAGADEFLCKPVGGLELRARVRSMLRLKRQHDQLLATMQLREDLANMVAHDMRNPLAAILGYTELLQLEPDLSEEPRKYVAEAHASALRLKRFIDDYLVQAKMEEGRIKLNRTPVDMVRLMAKVKENHAVVAQSKHVFIQVAIDESAGLGKLVEVDAALFERLLDNLLSNAIKYSKAGSDVRIAIDYPKPGDSTAAPGSQLRVRFTDTGAGVPPEDRDRIFEKYEIVALKQAKGSQIGLGLAFCKLVVQAHGGRIYVEPNQPRGSIFTVEI